MSIMVVHDYTVSAPSVVDAHGNVYTLDQSSPDATNAMRCSLFSAPVNAALSAGDRITVRFSGAVVNKTVTINSFFRTCLHGQPRPKKQCVRQFDGPGWEYSHHDCQCR